MPDENSLEIGVADEIPSIPVRAMIKLSCMKASLHYSCFRVPLLTDLLLYGQASCSRGAVNSVPIIRGLFFKYFVHEVVDGGLLAHVSPFRTPSVFCHFGSSELCRAFI
jgi:hypothetical protein